MTSHHEEMANAAQDDLDKAMERGALSHFVQARALAAIAKELACLRIERRYPLRTVEPEEPKSRGVQGELWNADPDCDHHIVSAPGGGVKCTNCSGWFCF